MGNLASVVGDDEIDGKSQSNDCRDNCPKANGEYPHKSLAPQPPRRDAAAIVF